jgi:drug/metabolite transporter (DMT)-like permease
MITVLLGTTAAIVYGAGDFFGGLAAKRLKPVVVTALAATIGIIPILLGMLVVPSAFSPTAFVWGAAGGLAGAIGIVLLYACLSVGPMSILSPITAVVSAVVPVLVGLISGLTLSPVAFGAVVLAAVAIVLVAVTPNKSGARLRPLSVLMAVGSGVGFGVFVLALNATPTDSGLAPILVARVLNAILMGTIAVVLTARAVRSRRQVEALQGALILGDVALRGPVLPSEPTQATTATAPATIGPAQVSKAARAKRISAGLVVILFACGFCDAGANILIQLGLHSSTDPSTLAVVSVLNALYPVSTIVLAAIVLHERVRPVQLVGMILALIAAAVLAVA